MDKKILFMAYNKATGVISGAADSDLTVIAGSEFPTALNIKLPAKELERFEEDNALFYNDEYKVYTLGEEPKNPLLLATNCQFVSKNNDGSYTYSADSWKWV
ncbi:TPA: hypothetical protein U1354_002069 [Streptococcus suis]|nr:hypothetical protein [Streptococcus suis]